MATNEVIVQKIQDGVDVSANMEMLYLQNRGLIATVAKRYSGIEDTEDLIQEGYFGLLEAAKRYNPQQGSFSHYAAGWIRAFMGRYVENCGGVMRVASYQRGRVYKYKQLVNNYQLEHGTVPADSVICEQLQLSPEQLEEVRRAAITMEVRSLDTEVAEESDTTLLDLIAAPVNIEEDTVEKVHQEELSKALWAEVDALDKQEASVVRGKYQHNLTMKQCGAAVGLSADKAKLIEQKALRKLRRPDVTRRLQQYLEEYSEYAVALAYSRVSVTQFQDKGLSSTEIAAYKLMEYERRINRLLSKK